MHAPVNPLLDVYKTHSRRVIINPFVFPSVGGFVPTDNPGCILWLSDTGSSPATWPDLSGSGNNGTQSNPGKQPSIQNGDINGLQARRFDGLNDELELAGFTLTSDYAVFATLLFPAGTTCLLGNTSNFQLITPITPDQYQTYDGSSVQASSGFSTVGSWGVLSIIRTLGVTSFFENGVARGGGSSASGSIPINRIGQLLNVLFFASDAAEIAVHDATFTTLQRQTEENYMLSKYGI